MVPALALASNLNWKVGSDAGNIASGTSVAYVACDSNDVCSEAVPQRLTAGSIEEIVDAGWCRLSYTTPHPHCDLLAPVNGGVFHLTVSTDFHPAAVINVMPGQRLVVEGYSDYLEWSGRGGHSHFYVASGAELHITKLKLVQGEGMYAGSIVNRGHCEVFKTQIGENTGISAFAWGGTRRYFEMIHPPSHV